MRLFFQADRTSAPPIFYHHYIPVNNGNSLIPSEDLLTYQIVAVMILCMVIIVIFFTRYRLKAKKEWEKAARRLQLTYRHSPLWMTNQEIVGTYRGHTLRVFVKVVGYGRSAKTFTCYEMTLDSDWKCGVEVESRQRGLLMKHFIPTLSRSHLIKVGNSQFDEAFFVMGKLPSSIQEVLRDPDIIRIMRGTSSHYERLNILEGKVSVRHKGVANDALRMRTTLNRLADLAGDLNEAVGPTQREEPDFLFPDPVTTRDEEPSPIW